MNTVRLVCVDAGVVESPVRLIHNRNLENIEMNDGMDRIALLDLSRREKFTRPAARLVEAQRKQHRSFHERPIQRDVFPEFDAIAAWPTVTCCYFGIEQAMKCLLQMRDAFIDQDKRLCKACFRRVEGSGSEECRDEDRCGYKHFEPFFQSQRDFVHSLDKRDRWHKHHHIGKLFHALACEEQEVLRVSYKIYRSLHDYIPPETVDCFLDAIDDGHLTWRYFLLDGEMPPTTHPGAMLEIWSALCDILMARTFTNHGLDTVKQRIDYHLSLNRLQDIWVEFSGTGIDRHEFEDIFRWRQTSHQNVTLNAYADLFFHHAESSLDCIEVLPSTKKILTTTVGIVSNQHVDNDLAHFLLRAQMGDIIWNPFTYLFERKSRAEEIEVLFIESEHYFVKELLGHSVKAEIVDSVPAYIEDFIFEPRVKSEIVDEDWSVEDEARRARKESEAKKAEIREYEGGNECEGYSCHINGTELIIVLNDSKEWIVYRYHNDDVPGVPHHCKNINEEVRSIREAIRAIEHWRRTEQKELELYRKHMWNRRGKRRSRARRGNESS